MRILFGFQLFSFFCGCVLPTAAETEEGRPWPGPDDEVPRRRAEFDLQGHRGARGLLPENTLPAFIRALELGVDTLEMDVVVNAEGHVVVSHEPWMSATICSHPDGRPVTADQERSLNIYRMDDATVAGFDCGSRPHPEFPHQEARATRKPLLAEVFASALRFEESNARAPVNFSIEIKSRPEHDGVYHPPADDFALALFRVVSDFRLQHRTAIQSFDLRVLEAIRRIDPALATVLLVGNDSGLSANLARLSFKPDVYSPHFERVDPQLVRQLRAHGIRLIPWTVNDPAAMKRLIEWGVDGLITDYPGVAIDVLRSAGIYSLLTTPVRGASE